MTIKTDKQVIDFAKLICNRYDSSDEKFHTAIVNYQIRHNLTEAQLTFLSEVKHSMSGQSNIDGIYLDCGYPTEDLS